LCSELLFNIAPRGEEYDKRDPSALLGIMKENFARFIINYVTHFRQATFNFVIWNFTLIKITKMKKLFLCLVTAFLSSAYFSMESKAATRTDSHSKIAVKSVESAEARILLARLDYIYAMDKSDLSRIERKQLRMEVRSIKSRMNEPGGAKYLSVGAVVIMAMLIILLL
jgi:hypothetical protein